MNVLNRKLSKKSGFTLVEMLIVVAIIAILIAVSIPLVSQALEKARDATDQANERAAKAEATMVYMGVAEINGLTTYKGGEIKDTDSVYYDAASGQLKSGTAPTTAAAGGYGKCTDPSHGDFEDKAHAHENCAIKVEVSANGVVTLTWSGEELS